MNSIEDFQKILPTTLQNFKSQIDKNTKIRIVEINNKPKLKDMMIHNNCVDIAIEDNNDDDEDDSQKIIVKKILNYNI